MSDVLPLNGLDAIGTLGATTSERVELPTSDQIDAKWQQLEDVLADADGDFTRAAPNATARRAQKLIIQIPCFNEEATLGVTLRALPRQVPGVDVVEWMIIDDGSADDTIGVARAHGIDHVVQLPRHQGLARAFAAGLDAALRLDADIIVNTDADNQYCAEDIARLIEPIVQHRAEYVVGARPIADTAHFTPLKKLLQRVGSWVVRKVSRTDIPDAPSGFRAMSRSTAMQLHVFSDYTYTLETIIQAGQKQMAVTWVPVRTNGDLRPSRLLRSIPGYVGRSALTIMRIFATYRPFPFFALPGTTLAGVGLLLLFRYLCLYVTTGGAGHVQSVVLGALLTILGLMAIVVGILADLISVNRKLLEQVNYRVLEVGDRLRRSSQDAE